MVEFDREGIGVVDSGGGGDGRTIRAEGGRRKVWTATDAIGFHLRGAFDEAVESF